NSWKGVLEAVAEAWRTQPDGIIQQAGQLTTHLKQVSMASGTGPRSSVSSLDREMLGNLLKSADHEFGGFGPAPKFPGSFDLQYLLSYSRLNREQEQRLAEEAMRHVRLSLDHMMAGGFYDQIGGGF